LDLRRTAPKHTTPEAPPIAIAAIGVTNPAAGVTATSPATSPEAAPSAVGLPCFSHSAAHHVVSAAAAATCVFTNAREASPFAARALPALNPNQPNQRRAAPSTVMVRLCGGRGLWRLPSTRAKTSAAAPLEWWMTRPP